MEHAASRLMTRLDSTRLCWCVCTAAAVNVSKPQSHCRVFVRLTGLDWTRLDCWCVRTLSLFSPSDLDQHLHFAQRTCDRLTRELLRVSIHRQLKNGSLIGLKQSCFTEAITQAYHKTSHNYKMCNPVNSQQATNPQFSQAYSFVL